MTNRSQKSVQRTAICHFSLVICHLSLFAKSRSACSAVVRKNVAPASSRQTVLLTQKELSRLTCRRVAGATILSHDLCLRGETGPKSCRSPGTGNTSSTTFVVKLRQCFTAGTFSWLTTRWFVQRLFLG